MDVLLRKYLWALDLAVIGLCAVFLARAAASGVESGYLMDGPGVRLAARPAKNVGQTVYNKQTEGILKRNVFCSTCPPLFGQPIEGDKTPLSDTPVKSSLPLALMAIMYAPPPYGLTWSVAVLRDTEDKSMGAFPVGWKIRGATITEILETRVYLDNNGRPEFIDLFEGPAPATLATTSPTPGASAGNDQFSQELDRGIKKTGENTYTIQRSTLESVLSNMNLLSRSARIVPEIRDGKAAGFRLYSVRPDGPFAKIGMQNGDVISSINGLEITSPEKALEVYSKLKSASHLGMGLERNGQKITKDYSIR